MLNRMGEPVERSRLRTILVCEASSFERKHNIGFKSFQFEHHFSGWVPLALSVLDACGGCRWECLA